MTVLDSCPQCRTVLVPGQRSCLKCGADSDASGRECPECHRPAGADARFCGHCGHRLDAAEAATEPAQPAAADLPKPFVTPREPGVKAYLGLGLVLAVVVGLLGGAYAIQRIWYTPEAAVRGYFEALQARDATAALSYLGLDQAPHLDRSLLTGKVLRGDGYTAPSDLRIREVSRTEESGAESGVAVVSYRIADQTYQDSVQVDRDEATTFGMFHRWRINGGLRLLKLAAVAGAPVRINGVAVPPGDSEDQEDARPLIVFPGRYTIGIASNPLLEGKPQVVVATPGGSEVRLDVQIRVSAVDTVQDQVKAYLDECAKSTELEPPNCPFRGYVFLGTVTNLDWSIERYPGIVVQLNYDGEVTVRSTGYGIARVTGEYSGGGDYSREDFFYLSGIVTVVDGEITFHPSE